MPIHYEISPAVYDYIISDEEWLWQMLLNYLTNACKYTDRGSITVRVSLVDANPSSYHACISASCAAIAASSAASAASAASDDSNSATDARCILTTEGTASINGEERNNTTKNSSKLLFEVVDTGEV